MLFLGYQPVVHHDVGYHTVTPREPLYHLVEGDGIQMLYHRDGKVYRLTRESREVEGIPVIVDMETEIA